MHKSLYKNIKVIHLINGLGLGGAESMLYKILAHQKREDIIVVTLEGRDYFNDKLEALGVKVITLNMRRGIPSLRAVFQYVTLIRKVKPDVIISWMYHANIFSILTKPVLPKHKTIFNIRQSLYDLNKEKRLTYYIIKLNARLSSYADLIVNNSKQSIEQHKKIGFSESNNQFIPNGFELDKFKPSLCLRNEFRKKYDIQDGIIIIGNLARFHPMKNHLGLIKAFKTVKNECKHSLKLVLGGDNINSDNREIKSLIDKLGLSNDCILLGRVESVNVLPAFDIYISASLWGEGFPNVLGEAMACGVPCVSTDIGDSRRVIGNTGIVIGHSDNDIADGIIRMLSMPKEEFYKLKTSAQEKVIKNYAIETISRQYEQLYCVTE